MSNFPLIFTLIEEIEYNKALDSFSISSLWPNIWIQMFVHMDRYFIAK